MSVNLFIGNKYTRNEFIVTFFPEEYNEMKKASKSAQALDRRILNFVRKTTQDEEEEDENDSGSESEDDSGSESESGDESDSESESGDESENEEDPCPFGDLDIIYLEKSQFLNIDQKDPCVLVGVHISERVCGKGVQAEHEAFDPLKLVSQFKEKVPKNLEFMSKKSTLFMYNTES